MNKKQHFFPHTVIILGFRAEIVSGIKKEYYAGEYSTYSPAYNIV
jgi:hypothetical protein